METGFKFTKQIIFIFILLFGLGLAVFLAQKTQLFKSKAHSDAVGVSAPNGSPVELKNEGGETYFSTSSDSVQFSVKDLEVLKK